MKMMPSDATSRNLRRSNARNTSTNSDNGQQLQSGPPWWVILTTSRVVIPLVVFIATFEVVRYAKIHNEIVTILHEHQDRTFGMPPMWSSACEQTTTATGSSIKGRSTKSLSSYPKTTIAYATSITAYDPTVSHHKLIDRAAVLHQSIRLASQNSPRYDYHMYAFVHPDAAGCVSMLQKLGYRVQIRETPFNESLITNKELAIAQRNGCCGAKVRGP
jgi:hypothetical protein